MTGHDQLLTAVAQARAKLDRTRAQRAAGQAGHADLCTAEATLSRALDAARAGGAIVDRARLDAAELLGGAG